ncbi:helix-turn-helix transcriptional regulator [Chryseobacterium koreense]|uniref:HTH cro/C1-type domain-containing protein n=1 Tax=Chryseobacterium koreense CCUG 49689 TaxID=1304281 RepID=A0A0J7IWH6_9FLAO|nr:helix-turn-helix transcriptional regulator [Chryseobacterium koreense]KMQ70156.1 hypothetical protein ACM44_13870 [Chryseobacterium koreense CCUG 49689]MBB5333938.1 transcriptional regulator with XRE-family HTH domain [Chryseobacterium koreense]
MDNKFTEEFEILGDLIRRKRKKTGLTQQALADKIPKLDRAKISDIENGKEDFHFSTLLKICEALDTTLEKIINNEKED